MLFRADDCAASRYVSEYLQNIQLLKGNGSLTEDEVILLDLPRADLLLQRVAADVDVAVETRLVEDALDLLDVLVGRLHDGDDEDLARREPEGPLAGEVFA